MKKAATKTKIVPKAGKIKFLILFKLNFEKKKATTKTKIVPKAGKNNFLILFKSNFE